MITKKASIEINYREAKQEKEKLEALAKSLGRIASEDLSSALQDISSNWTGSNAKAYIQKGEELKRDIIRSQKKLKEIAEYIGTASKNYYDAEMRAYWIAVNRDK